MALTLVDAQVAAGDTLSQVTRHLHGRVGVLLAVPDAHRDLDVGGVESPWPGTDACLVHGAAHALAEGLGSGSYDLTAQAGIGQCLPVSLRQAPGADVTVNHLRRVTSHAAGMLGEQRPP